jgi:hypothetical protein
VWCVSPPLNSDLSRAMVVASTVCQHIRVQFMNASGAYSATEKKVETTPKFDLRPSRLKSCYMYILPFVNIFIVLCHGCVISRQQKTSQLIDSIMVTSVNLVGR